MIFFKKSSLLINPFFYWLTKFFKKSGKRKLRENLLSVGHDSYLSHGAKVVVTIKKSKENGKLLQEIRHLRAGNERYRR